MKLSFTTLFVALLFITQIQAQHSVARQWNEALLDAIRVDISRPTVHSRNLYQVSAVMYDAWAAYDEVADPCLLGRQVGDYFFAFDGVEVPVDPSELKAAREEAISYAAYRVLRHRFANSPGAAQAIPLFDSLMLQLGYDTSYHSTDYSNGDPAALGNYLALGCMEYGLVDYSNEQANYSFDQGYYQPVNPPLNPSLPGNPNIVDMNHWQPLEITPGSARTFLGPHWGAVTPYSLTDNDLTVFDHDGNEYLVYHDPGSPPLLDTIGSADPLEDYYKWNFALVAIWSGHLDPDNPAMLDISPASLGNISALPTNEEEMRAFYDLLEGGVTDIGYDENPVTGEPYEPQLVPMGDFGRVLAEFWADGPNSETPPGHWFTILNYVNDHPMFEKRFQGEGPILDDLEWDVKAYLVLGGAMHDVAVAVWGVKSHYDYIRPISAIRGMAELGQSSDSSEMSYHPGGLPLLDGHIELIKAGDPLEGEQGENIGKIKLYAWQGPAHISDPDIDVAGVDWILAENWWPYQQPNFVTPPFAGYISGHSTFSRAAAEVLTLLTGDEYFPGGMGVFDAPMNEFLIFEDGPSMDIELQWARYRDASDQASLSRLWGGIHPPIDDIPGRMMGMKIGPQAFDYSLLFFGGMTPNEEPSADLHSDIAVLQNYPNPALDHTVFEYSVRHSARVQIEVFDLNGNRIRLLDEGQRLPGVYRSDWTFAGELAPGIYHYRLIANDRVSRARKMVVLGS